LIVLSMIELAGHTFVSVLVLSTVGLAGHTFVSVLVLSTEECCSNCSDRVRPVLSRVLVVATQMRSFRLGGSIILTLCWSFRSFVADVFVGDVNSLVLRLLHSRGCGWVGSVMLPAGLIDGGNAAEDVPSVALLPIDECRVDLLSEEVDSLRMSIAC
jgi:hypothetical protein